MPFLVRWPGKVESASRCDQTLCLTDVMATCATLTGARLPDNAAEDSVDFSLVLLGKAGARVPREFTLQQAINGALAIRRGPWKYLDHQGSGGNNYNDPELRPFALKNTAPNAPGQLYNLDKDPGETTNVYFDNPEIVKQLKDQLDACKRSGRSTPRVSLAP